ncbi:MAG: cob(I)yrinic acid a,c-diamide adenosyltransferase [Planctomycetota bacterium]|nr:cob(I)yrinic acid a,c-diamide adenosyltransferase [Planctomycetota bacterium]
MRRSWRGMVQVYTGDGKGKTTAALGLAVRAAGAGLRVWLGHFLKARPCSEHRALAMLRPRPKVEFFGSGRWLGARKPDAREKRLAKRGLAAARKAIKSGRFQVAILDEINCALSYRLLAVKEVLALLRHRPVGVEVVLTGRRAPRRLLGAADLVTEMRAVRHYFQRGVASRIGIEE